MTDHTTDLAALNVAVLTMTLHGGSQHLAYAEAAERAKEILGQLASTGHTCPTCDGTGRVDLGVADEAFE